MRQILMIVAAFCACGCAMPAGAAPGGDVKAGSADRGLFVALQACAACHAIAVRGLSPDGLAPGFAAIQARHDLAGLEALLTEIAQRGHAEMPPIAISPQEVKDLAAYIETVDARPRANKGR